MIKNRSGVSYVLSPPIFFKRNNNNNDNKIELFLKIQWAVMVALYVFHTQDSATKGPCPQVHVLSEQFFLS